MQRLADHLSGDSRRNPCSTPEVIVVKGTPGPPGSVIQFTSLVAPTTCGEYRLNVLSPLPEDESSVGVVIQTRGAGALMRQIPDSEITGGDCRGAMAVDWQAAREDSDMVASGEYSVLAGGLSNKSSGARSVCSGGYLNAANGIASVVAGGRVNTSSGTTATVVGGELNVASAETSTVSGGYKNSAAAVDSAIGGGSYNHVEEDALYGTIPGGYGLTLNYEGSTAAGRFNRPGEIDATDEDTQRVFMVGYGDIPSDPTDPAANRFNLFSVTKNGDAHIKGTTYGNGGADFAEMFESVQTDHDNPIAIPVGTSVVFEGGLIREAEEGEVPFGVVTNRAAFIGNAATEEWVGKYKRDEDGNFMTETVEIGGRSVTKRVLSNDYNPSITYIPRIARPEWSIVALLGVVKILDEQVKDPRWINIKEDSWLIR